MYEVPTTEPDGPRYLFPQPVPPWAPTEPSEPFPAVPYTPALPATPHTQEYPTITSVPPQPQALDTVLDELLRKANEALRILDMIRERAQALEQQRHSPVVPGQPVPSSTTPVAEAWAKALSHPGIPPRL